MELDISTFAVSKQFAHVIASCVGSLSITPCCLALVNDVVFANLDCLILVSVGVSDTPHVTNLLARAPCITNLIYQRPRDPEILRTRKQDVRQITLKLPDNDTTYRDEIKRLAMTTRSILLLKYEDQHEDELMFIYGLCYMFGVQSSEICVRYNGIFSSHVAGGCYLRCGDCQYTRVRVDTNQIICQFPLQRARLARGFVLLLCCGHQLIRLNASRLLCGLPKELLRELVSFLYITK